MKKETHYFPKKYPSLPPGPFYERFRFDGLKKKRKKANRNNLTKLTYMWHRHESQKSFLRFQMKFYSQNVFECVLENTGTIKFFHIMSSKGDLIGNVKFKRDLDFIFL